jgi:ABC-type Fe3+ transport system substrate-binding protein
MIFSKFKRTKVLINPQFQLSVIRYMLFLTFIIVAVFYAANLYHFWALKKQGLLLGLPSDHIFFWFIDEQQRNMDILFLVTSAVALLTIVCFGLLISHRVAGPMFRICQYLLSPVATKDLQALKLRDKDYFHDVADALNERLGRGEDKQ